MADEESRPDFKLTDFRLILIDLIFAPAADIPPQLAGFEILDSASYRTIKPVLDQLEDGLKQIGPHLESLPDEIRGPVEEIGAIYNNAKVNIGFCDICRSLIESNLSDLGDQGWREYLRLTKSSDIAWARPAQPTSETLSGSEEQVSEKAGSAASKYTIVDLQSDLASVKNLEERMKHLGWDGLLRFTETGTVESVRQQSVMRLSREKGELLANIDCMPGVEQLRLICEAEGAEWSENWVKQQRANWCIANDCDTSIANAMTVVEFARLMRPKRTNIPEQSGNAFEQLLVDFREAWSDLGRVYHMIDLYAPDPYDSRNLPFDRDKCDVIAQVCMPIMRDQPVTPNMNNSTLHGFAVIEKNRDNQGAADRIRGLFNRAGAALPLQFEPVIRGLCPWYMNEPATQWLALMLIATGKTARDSKGQYIGKEILEKPLKLSVRLIEAYRLNTDKPITRFGGEAMPVYTGEDDESDGDQQEKPSPKLGTTHRRTIEEIFKSALRKHHNYEHPSKEFNYQPASYRTLEKLSGKAISDTTAGRLIKDHFESDDNYKQLCANGSIREKLSLLMGDFCKSVDPTIFEETVPDDDEGK